MFTMRTSGENLARSEARNGIMRNSPFKWAGLDRPKTFSGVPAYFTPASPLKRVFYWARFHQTARMRQQVRYPCSDVCLNCKQANQLNPALTAPIVTRPVKLPRADLTRYKDRTPSNRREDLVPACLQRAARDSGDLVGTIHREKGRLWAKGKYELR